MTLLPILQNFEKIVWMQPTELFYQSLNKFTIRVFFYKLDENANIEPGTLITSDSKSNTGQARLIQSHSSARFCFELSRNSY